MNRIDRWFAAHPRIAAALCGLLSATGFPPLHLWPVALLGIGAFALVALRAPTWRSALLNGWLFGLAHFTLANNWIATAFTYQAEMPAWLGWLAVPLLAVYLAVYPALAALIAWGLGRRLGAGAASCVFGGAWIVTEWLRSWVFTGYAWDPFGLVLLGPFDRPGLAAVLPWTGTYALSGFAALVGAMLIVLLRERRFVPFAAVAVLLAAGMYWPAPAREEGTMRFTLVQPDLRQPDLDNPAKFEEQFARIAQLSVPREPGTQRLVLWPESGVPDYLRDGYPQRYYDQLTAAGDPRYARWRIGRVIGEGSMLLTGAVDLEIGMAEGQERAVGAYNTITPISAEGTLGERYAKAHLVPYGEYLPMRWLLEPLGLTRLVPGAIDFLPGPGPRTLDLGEWGKAGAQICYEIVFSGQVVDRGDRPDYIFNPSNDGWFGAWGPPQHLAQARMRAIEEGLPVLRSTTTGISAVIDARGVVRDHIGMHRADRIDGIIPPARAPTLFSRTGNWLAIAWALLLIAGSLVATRLRGR
ncbi:apolipoprotein N-acyltransferase [Pelagerythrobacter sp.]|uniref:apolipoprotein N-acyltransferase n=1 Tax=Pelagerythrobacter sp. TaxID=2800702 RepID=UPI0035AE280E